jgi:WD40 repeat protein
MKRRNVIILVLLLATLNAFYVRAQEDGDHLPITVANAHEVTQLAMLERGYASSLVWSPDGKTLAVASSVGVWLYNDTDLTSEPRLLTENVQTSSAAFSPDGTLLAVGTWDSTVQVWDVQTGQQLHLFQPVEPQFSLAGEVAFSPDGTVIAAGHGDGRIRLWDVTTGEIRATLDQTCNMISLAYRPDGAVLASASFDNNRIWLWDTASGENLDILENDYFGVTTLPYSPDGATLAAGFRDEGGVVLWDTAARQIRSVVADNTYIS